MTLLQRLLRVIKGIVEWYVNNVLIDSDKSMINDLLSEGSDIRIPANIPSGAH